MVELRKRKAPAPLPVAEKKTKPAPKPKQDADATDNDIEKSPASKVPEVDDTIDLETFGGEFETNEGETTTLKKLLEESKSGVVFFTYPKASTPGCKSPHHAQYFSWGDRAVFSEYFAIILLYQTAYVASSRYQASLLVP